MSEPIRPNPGSLLKETDRVFFLFVFIHQQRKKRKPTQTHISLTYIGISLSERLRLHYQLDADGFRAVAVLCTVQQLWRRSNDSETTQTQMESTPEMMPNLRQILY